MGELAEAKLDRLQAQKKGRSTMPQTEAQKLRRIKSRRTEIVGRIRRNIERVFAAGGPGGGLRAGTKGALVAARRLPWRVLPLW
jgi:hypothetical protein